MEKLNRLLIVLLAIMIPREVYPFGKDCIVADWQIAIAFMKLESRRLSIKILEEGYLITVCRFIRMVHIC